MRRFSCVVLLETLFKITGHPQIALTLRRQALDEVDVIHKPSFAEASETILFRAENYGNPAKRVSAKQDESAREWLMTLE
jgi:hypothetical protein